MAHFIALASLTPREAVADTLYRAILGLDTNDYAIFESAWDKNNAIFDRDGTVLDGWEAIHKNLFQVECKMGSHHLIGNPRISFKDEDTAYMTAYTIARHDRSGEGLDPTKKGLIGGSTYSIDLVRDGSDGLWKMRKWAMKLNWIDGDVLVVTEHFS